MTVIIHHFFQIKSSIQKAHLKTYFSLLSKRHAKQYNS